MKAVIFAAGKGTRLKPFTDSHPKALAPVCGKPMLGRVIEKLIAAGADGIVVNVHHFASQVIDFIESRNFPVPIEISDESGLLLETGGALAKIARESQILKSINANESIIVHNCDIYTDFPINEMCMASQGVEGVLLTDPSRQTSRKFLFDSAGCLCGWTNESNGAVRPSAINPNLFSHEAFGGVHCIHRHTLDNINLYCGNELHPFSVVDYYIDVCAAKGTIKAFTPTKSFRWIDIGTAEHLAQVQNIIL